MGEWGDTPPTFDRSTAGWGAEGALADEDAGGGEAYLEMIGSELWVAGMLTLGRFRRVSDFVNIADTYVVLHDVVFLTRMGESTGLVMPELHVLTDDVAVVGQLADDKPPAPVESGLYVEKVARRLVVLTRSHVIDGEVFVHGDTSIMAFAAASDPRFIPMTDVRVRWISDRKLAARYPFGLLQRSQIQGVVTESIKLGGAEETQRRAAMLKAQVNASNSGDRDRLGAAGSASPAQSPVANPAAAPVAPQPESPATQDVAWPGADRTTPPHLG